MKATFFSLAALASLAAAQTTAANPPATAPGGCEANYIVEACLGTTMAVFNACNVNDWDCRCAAYGAIVTCYNNCPNDGRQASAMGQQQIYCGYASQYPSTTRTVASQTSGASTQSTPTSGGTQTSNQAGQQSPSNTAASNPVKPNAAASDLAFSAGGVLAAVAGVVAAML